MARSNNKKTETDSTPVVADAPADAPKTSKRARKAEAVAEAPVAAPVAEEAAPAAKTTKRGRKAAPAEAEAAVPEAPAAAEEAPASKPKRGRKAAAAVEEASPEPTAAEEASEEAETPSKTPSKRRVITPDVLDAEIVEFINGIESEIKRVELSDNKSGSKYLKTLVKKARDIQKHAQKVKGKRAKPTPAASTDGADTPAKSKAPSGIQKPVAIIPEFAKFLGVSADTLISRVEGGKAINKYIKEKGLKDSTPGKGKNINPDKTLSRLLAFTPTEETPLTYNSMMKHMQRLFVKATPAVA